MNELKSNPKRQANYTIDAYVHQIWHSLLRWIDLKEGEALFLEGAEDIDHYRSDEVRTIQVKKTFKPLTLGSKDALESIAKFWEHKRQNPNVTVKFQFLTTAERGKERSNPFGEVKGLDLWDSCKHQGANPKALRDFLSGQRRLPKELREFIGNATDEQLRLELLIPLEWNTGGNPQPFVEDVVNRKVSDYGDRVFDLQYSESVKTIPQLLQHVLDTARRKDGRWLYASDFRRLFEEAITERVPRPELQRLRLAERSFAQLGIRSAVIGMAGESKVMRLTESILEVLRPLHNQRLVRRRQLVTGLLDRLNR